MTATMNSITGQFTYWRQATFPHLLPASEKTRVVIGCGTSYNLALAIATTLTKAGHKAIAVPSGEWLDRPRSYLPEDTQVEVIALSRSGTTTETVRAAQASRAHGKTVTSLICARDTALEAASDVAHVFETHPEEGIVMTCSASLMLLAGYAMSGHRIDDTFVTHAEASLEAFNKIDTVAIHSKPYVVYLGGGAQYGIALEGALKLMEMSITITQTFHPGEYRHGPISLVDDGTVAIMLYNDETQDAETGLVDELQEKGATVIGFGGAGDISVDLKTSGDLAGAEVLPLLQMLGERHAIFRGCDTTAPRHLSKVVVLS